MGSKGKDFFCTQCSLKFDSSLVYGRHIKLGHAKKNQSLSRKNETERTKSIEGDIDKVKLLTKFDTSNLIPSNLERKECPQCEWKVGAL